MKYLLSLIVFLITLNLQAQSQLVINEFSAANQDDFMDNYFNYSDWIELYNNSISNISLNGYYLSDDIDEPTKWQFPNNLTLASGDYLVVYASGRDETNDPASLHTNFKLTQTKNEAVVLSDNNGTPIDAYVIVQPNKKSHSYGRVPDGSGEWNLITNPSPNGVNNSSVMRYAAKPIFDMEAGAYNGSINVSLVSEEANASIYYTLDGSIPDVSSTMYVDPIQVSETVAIRAITISQNTDIEPSFVETNTYFIDVEHTIDIVSICGDELETLLGGEWIDPIGSFELFDTEGSFIEDGLGDFNKHGNDSWDYSQRGFDYISRDEYGVDNNVDHKIFDNKERTDFQRLIFKPGANDNYPFEFGGAYIRDAYVHTLSQNADLELDERTYRPCAMYVNGQYWGLYEIREKVDDNDFTSEYYDQGRKWIDFIKTWGFTWEEYGTIEDWNALYDFIINNDMSDPANYEMAAEQLNMQSLVDYMIINTHVVCKDWLNYNTAWWRGRKPNGDAQKWRYTLWDMDATFGHYINYTGIPEIGPEADPCDNEEIDEGGDPEGHVDLTTSLLANETFHSLYVNRYADLNNSFFTCDYMQGLLDEMIGTIEGEMERQIQRWGGTYSEWELNVQTLRDFINERCAVIDSGIIDCYEVEGPYEVTVAIVPSSSDNKVRVNTFIPSQFPFIGDYYSNTTLSFEAVPSQGWFFTHWEVANATFSPDQTAIAIQMSIQENEQITAHFSQEEALCELNPDVIVAEGYTTINLSWEPTFTAISYEVGFKPMGSTQAYATFSIVEPEVSLVGLESCTEYDIRLRPICSGNVGTYSNIQAMTDCTISNENAAFELLEYTVYPNPFDHQLNIDLVFATSAAEIQLEIYNLQGQVITQKEYKNLNQGVNRLTLDQKIQSIPSGNYFLRLVNQNGIQLTSSTIQKQ